MSSTRMNWNTLFAFDQLSRPVWSPTAIALGTGPEAVAAPERSL
jgi:hypothetical protein